MKLLQPDKLGSCPIDSVKLYDAKEWALRMKEKGISYKTISNDTRSLKAVFYTAEQEESLPQSNDTPHPASYVLHQLSQCWNEPESVTVYHGIFQHHHDAELLHTRNFCFRKG